MKTKRRKPGTGKGYVWHIYSMPEPWKSEIRTAQIRRRHGVLAGYAKITVAVAA